METVIFLLSSCDQVFPYFVSNLSEWVQVVQKLKNRNQIWFCSLCFWHLPNSNTKNFFSSLNSLKSVHLFPIALFQPCPSASYIDHSNPFYYISVHIIFLKCKSEHVIPLCKDLKGYLYPVWTWGLLYFMLPRALLPLPTFQWLWTLYR